MKESCLATKKLKIIVNGHVQCLDCNKTYPNISIAKIHYKNAHREKNICCKACNKYFVSKNHLAQHLRNTCLITKNLKLIENG